MSALAEFDWLLITYGYGHTFGQRSLHLSVEVFLHCLDRIRQLFLVVVDDSARSFGVENFIRTAALFTLLLIEKTQT